MFDPVERDFNAGNNYDNSTAPSQNWLTPDQISNTKISANMRRCGDVARIRETSADGQVVHYESYGGQSMLAIGDDRAAWASTQWDEYEALCIEHKFSY